MSLEYISNVYQLGNLSPMFPTCQHGDKDYILVENFSFLFVRYINIDVYSTIEILQWMLH